MAFYHSQMQSYFHSKQINVAYDLINPCHAEPGYILLENNVDPDQKPSEKPADQDPHCFSLGLQIHSYNWNQDS